MKPHFHFIILLALCVCATSFGQKCKYSEKRVRKANKHFEDKKIVKATKLKPLFSKFSQAASANFVKSDDDYYLSLVLVRELGRRIDILKDNPLIIRFQDDSIITLYPDRTLLGKFTLPVTTEINRPYYEVSAEQMQLLASQPVVYIKVYFSSDKVSEEKMGSDDTGIFFDYEILNKNLQASLMEPAECIVQE
ncbi:hypothetical protein FVB32_08335 [Flagellimonas hymeniacidonis]|uniref:Uncharacterized protein n=1 Tax=Flagellimonas hymeniacidonis TaxID=2603628 RepID=A0A5C8VBU9_9FLAO|nr:hypothetical protein [Flagellimonas hymeniacidonis]TXN38288.1 hypothetical protein FVB32_08335 [Flagellimonas hymeniacidonis]